MKFLNLNLGLREIQGIIIECDNLERGCNWLGTVGDLEDHLAKCGLSPVPCPNKCKVEDSQVLRKCLEDHLETKCPNRAYKCERCGLMGMYASIVGEHEQICKKKLVSCPHTECDLTIEQGKLKKHISTVCKFTEVPCKYHNIGCKVRKTRISVKKHEEEDDKAHLHMSLEKIDELVSTVSSMRMNANTVDKSMFIIFKMSEYIKKKQGDDIFYSEPFYSSPGGYKMRIKVYPNGYGEGKDTHVSIYLQLLVGPYNDNLQWPFIGTLVFELLNQLADRNHHTSTLALFEKRDARVGNNWGFGEFFLHSELSDDSTNDTQYLMEDTLYFKVTVTVEGHKPWLHCTHYSK